MSLCHMWTHLSRLDRDLPHFQTRSPTSQMRTACQPGWSPGPQHHQNGMGGGTHG